MPEKNKTKKQIASKKPTKPKPQKRTIRVKQKPRVNQPKTKTITNTVIVKEKWTTVDYIKLVVYIAIAIIVLLLFLYRVIQLSLVWDRQGTENTHAFFSFLNATFMGTLLVIIGVGGTRFKDWEKYVLVGCIVLFVFLDLGMLGFKIWINIPELFPQPFYQSNSSQGVWFFYDNLATFWTIAVGSLLVEADHV